MKPRRVLSGYWHDPLANRPTCLIVDSQPPFDGAAALAHARDQYPEAEVVLVRLGGIADSLDGEFTDYIWYLTKARAVAAVGTQGAPVSVRRAASADREFVVSRLTDAFLAAMRVRDEHPPQPVRAREHAESIVDDPDTVIYLAEHEGTPFGHATLLDEQYDDLDDNPFVDLLDVLIDRDHPHKTAGEALLVEAAASYAATRQLPLVGNIVVHENEPAFAPELYRKLHSNGWDFNHKLVIARLRPALSRQQIQTSQHEGATGDVLDADPFSKHNDTKREEDQGCN